MQRADKGQQHCAVRHLDGCALIEECNSVFDGSSWDKTGRSLGRLTSEVERRDRGSKVGKGAGETKGEDVLRNSVRYSSGDLILIKPRSATVL